MRLIAMLPVRNEDWILELSARAALLWCDAIVILNHASRDTTAVIILKLLHEFGNDRVKLKFVDGGWDEMQHRQRMLTMAREFGATHMAIVDADEILTGNLLGSIRSHIESMPGGRILQLPGYNLRGGLHRYHANGIWGDRWFSLAFADDKRLGWAGDRFHHREPSGVSLMPCRTIAQGQGGIMHLWGASERRLVAKHALYKMTETLRWPAKSKADIDQQYSQAIFPSANRHFDQNWEYAAVPADWWAPYADLLPSVHLDAVPWQEQACRDMVAEHGPERFAGLDLFDVCDVATVTR
jgi:hypothetical protein